MEPNSESSIIQRARQGDHDGINRLYEETKNYAYFVARRYLQNDEDIADILQDAYISAFSNLNTFEDGRPFKPWLRAIVVNKCLNFIKSKKAIFVSENEIGEIASDNEEIIPAAWLERAEKRRDIMRIIDGLPDGQRMAVTLFYFEGLSIAEMSEAMGIAEGTVKAHLYHGRKAIKEEVLREEKKGNKLYAIVPLPLLSQLFELEAEAAVMPEALSKAIWEGTINGLTANGTIAGPNATSSGTAAKGGGVTAKFAALSTGAKAGIIAAAVAVVVAAVGIPVYISQQGTSKNQPAAQVTDGSANSNTTIRNDTENTVVGYELLEPVEVDFTKDIPYKVDLDGDGVEDTVTVKKGGSADTLVISSSCYGEYSTMFDYTFEPDEVRLLAIDTGKNNYSLCVTMDTGGQGGAGSIDGLIICGTSKGWKRITSLLPVSYVFTGEILDNQMFAVEGETGYSEQLTTSNSYVQKGAKIMADNRISSITYALNEETGGYDFVVRQYLFSESVTNGIGFGNTQISIDADTKSHTPVKQWVSPFNDSGDSEVREEDSKETKGAETSKGNETTAYNNGIIVEVAVLDGYDSVGAFHCGLARVEKNRKFGYINTDGDIVIPLEYDSAGGFNEGLASVRKNGKSGFIDTTGAIVVPFDLEYSSIYPFSDGLALVTKKGVNLNYGFIDTNGEIVVPLGTYGIADSFSEGLASVQKNSQCGFIDTNGNIVIPLEYYSVSSGNSNTSRFSEGLAAVMKDGGIAFINTSGEVVIPINPEYSRNDGESAFVECRAGLFSEGLCWVAKGGNDQKYGFIDASGNMVIPMEYDNVESFRSGRALVRVKSQYGYIDTNGNFVVPLGEYRDSDMRSFSEGFAPVRKDGRWGYIDTSGEVAVPFEFYQVDSFSEGFAVVKKFPASKNQYVILRNTDYTD